MGRCSCRHRGGEVVAQHAAEELATQRTAQALGSLPFGVGRPRFVVFGHTHHAKKLTLTKPGATYLNTGTWAELMRFPPEVLSDDDEVARSALETFARQLDEGALDGLTRFEPTYVRLDVDDRGRVTRGELHDYDWERGKLTDPG